MSHPSGLPSSSCRAQQCSCVITALWSLSLTFFLPDATQRFGTCARISESLRPGISLAASETVSHQREQENDSVFYLCEAVTWPSRDPTARMKVSQGRVCDGVCQAFWGSADKLEIRAKRRLCKTARLKDYCLSNHFFFFFLAQEGRRSNTLHRKPGCIF